MRNKPNAPNANPRSELRLIPVPLSDEISPGDSLADKLLQSLRRTTSTSNPATFSSSNTRSFPNRRAASSISRRSNLPLAPSPGRRNTIWTPASIELALRESRAVIRQKNGVLITETHHGFICANSGVDVSNVDGGRHALLLPADPDRSARKLSSRNQEAHRARDPGS